MTDVLAPSMAPMGAMPTQQELELAAFEKGRLQGEMEATRRLDAERSIAQKQMLPAAGDAALMNPAASMVLRPDVIEINRLTWLQRAAFVLGELTTISFLGLTIAWLDRFRGDVSWSNGSSGGNVTFWNTHYLCNALGIFFLANAITNYRAFPINLHPMMNRAWYLFMQSAAIVCFTMALVSWVWSTPEDEMWSVASWCFLFGYALWGLHALYSMIVTCLEPLHHRHLRGKGQGNYGQWSETGTHLETPEQRRDHSAYNHQARTVYAPAPHHGFHLPGSNAHTDSRHGTHHGSASAMGTAVPAAPAGAPRWAESPNTHCEDYWLLPRAKWATVGFLAIGTGILMDFASQQQLLAAGRPNWAQAPGVEGDAVPIGTRSREAKVLGALGLMLLASLVLMAYVAMPPRTTLVKNGILVDPAANQRRSSISHNAETQLGPQNVV